MARIRTIKPEMATHEGLFDLEKETGLPIRFAWAMLPTVCDREGRFVWRPRTLKSQILPHDDLDFSRVLDAWLTRGFVVKYRVGNAWFGWLPTFKKHQVVNHRESPSDIPPVEQSEETQDHRNQADIDACLTRASRVDDDSGSHEGRASGEGKGKEGKGRKEKEHPPSGAFLRFWGAWPKHHRKQAQGKCWDRWRKSDFDQVSDQILAHVEALKRGAWLEEGGKYIPAPEVYLNNRRWEGADISSAQQSSESPLYRREGVM